jgi:predicted dinucleotide-utilizing enzyme
MKTKWNIAIIGCSDMGKQHIEGLLKNEKAVLYALCDSAPERVKAAAEEFKPEIAVTDYRELVNDPKLDAVILVVPDQIHLELTEAFLRAGKAVLCEKPMALSLEECCSHILNSNCLETVVITCCLTCRAFLNCKSEVLDSVNSCECSSLISGENNYL